MNTNPANRSPRRRVAVACVALGMLIGLATPAAAQYGGAPPLIVDPVRVPVDGNFDAFGLNCPGASTVTITIDGFPGTLATGIAADDSAYTINNIAMPAGVIAGNDYVVVATCAGGSSNFTITAVCNNGDDPVNGSCTSGNTVGGGGSDPGPGGSPESTVPGGSDNGSGNSSNLAVTGASSIEQFVTVGATLVAAGFVLVLLTGRRREADQPAPDQR